MNGFKYMHCNDSFIIDHLKSYCKLDINAIPLISLITLLNHKEGKWIEDPNEMQEYLKGVVNKLFREPIPYMDKDSVSKRISSHWLSRINYWNMLNMFREQGTRLGCITAKSNTGKVLVANGIGYFLHNSSGVLDTLFCVAIKKEYIIPALIKLATNKNIPAEWKVLLVKKSFDHKDFPYKPFRAKVRKAIMKKMEDEGSNIIHVDSISDLFMFKFKKPKFKTPKELNDYGSKVFKEHVENHKILYDYLEEQASQVLDEGQIIVGEGIMSQISNTGIYQTFSYEQIRNRLQDLASIDNQTIENHSNVT
jgi:hypothetical protein